MRKTSCPKSARRARASVVSTVVAAALLAATLPASATEVAASCPWGLPPCKAVDKHCVAVTLVAELCATLDHVSRFLSKSQVAYASVDDTLTVTAWFDLGPHLLRGPVDACVRLSWNDAGGDEVAEQCERRTTGTLTFTFERAHALGPFVCESYPAIRAQLEVTSPLAPASAAKAATRIAWTGLC
ncbi:MAG TPA: hypothetical protein VGR28_12560 [Candidatus Thermoplasmatota archaeon]|nr:hypothetical protein [Candidatus Thermoplasmatota archaeon]